MSNLENVIVQHYAGSISYGTNIKGSDTDIRGIFCAGAEAIRTPFYPVREHTLVNEEDGKLYELTAFVEMYNNANPNILETLWVDNKHIIEKSVPYDLLVEHRQALLSSKVAFTFSGYAFDQLKKVKGHNKWINKKQPKDSPKQTDYLTLVHNFTDKKHFSVNMLNYRTGYRLISYGGDIYGLYVAPGYNTFDSLYTLNTNTSEDMHSFYTKTPTISEKIAGFVLGKPDFGTRRLPLFILKFNKGSYNADKEQHANYWKWKQNRNKTRSLLEDQYGYDTKCGMHLVRLLRMAEEILTDGVVNVHRSDAQELLDIRNGAWTYEELLEYAEHMDNKVRNDLYHKTDLPKKPNIKLASKVLMECQDYFWSKK